MLTDSAAYEASRKQVQASKEVSGYLYIIAPFSGVITARKADPGSLVGATVPLLTLQDDHLLRLRIAVPEAYTAAANFAKPIHFRVEAYPNRSFPAVPARKTETINPDTRTELWEFEVNNGHQDLKAGAFAYAQLNLERNGPSLIVPPSAVATTPADNNREHKTNCHKDEKADFRHDLVPVPACPSVYQRRHSTKYRKSGQSEREACPP